jgi:DNA-binding beta-propeller fold protein YncE
MRIAPLALALGLAAAGRAEEFPANHLFVCAEDQDLVLGCDETGRVVRQLGEGSGLRGPAGLAFGADGLLYVASSGSDRVLAFDAAGSLVRTIDAGLTAPRGLCLGPDGSLYVGNGDGSIARLGANGTNVGRFGALSGPGAATDLCFGAGGHLYVARKGQATVLELDATGQLVRELGAEAGLREVSALAPGPDGRLAVADASAESIVLLDASGTVIATLQAPALRGAAGLCFGSDGLLYVMARGGSLLAVDAAGTVQRTLPGGPGLQRGGALAFAPRRFTVTVQGTLQRKQGAPLALTEIGTLSLSPGAATAVLQLADGARGDDLVSVFGGGTLTLRGFAAAQEGGRRWRLAASAGVQGMASVAAELSGEAGPQGLWLASGARGDLWRAGEAGSFRGTLWTGEALR